MAAKSRTKRPARQAGEDRARGDAPNPVWFLPVMLGFMIVGLLWIVVFYVSGSQFPVPSLGAWNILIGFAIAFIGFLMTTRWR